jgi:hypothetical protein
LVYVDHHSSTPLLLDNAENQILVLYAPIVSQKGIPFPKKMGAKLQENIVSMGGTSNDPDIFSILSASSNQGEIQQAHPRWACIQGSLTRLADKPGVYCLSLSPWQYRILWSDLSELYFSDDFQWDNLEPLISYVFSL